MGASSDCADAVPADHKGIYLGTFDPVAHTYARWQNAAGKAVREVDAANNVPIAAATVVIIQTEIWEVAEIVDAAGSHAHDMRLTGSGKATIFRDGFRQEAAWSRAISNYDAAGYSEAYLYTMIRLVAK